MTMRFDLLLLLFISTVFFVGGCGDDDTPPAPEFPGQLQCGDDCKHGGVNGPICYQNATTMACNGGGNCVPKGNVANGCGCFTFTSGFDTQCSCTTQGVKDRFDEAVAEAEAAEANS